MSCVSSDTSAQCQIHTMTMEDGVMKMRPVQGGLEIKPGETVMLKPSGFHVMLVNLKHPLQQGKMVNATLKFENAGTMNLIPRRSHRSGRARRSCKRGRHEDGRSRRHEANGQALTAALTDRST